MTEREHCEAVAERFYAEKSRESAVNVLAGLIERERAEAREKVIRSRLDLVATSHVFAEGIASARREALARAEAAEKRCAELDRRINEDIEGAFNAIMKLELERDAVRRELHVMTSARDAALDERSSVAARAERAEAACAQMRAALEAFAEEVDAAERHFESRGKGGQQVPFHGDFASVAQLPGVRSKLRWWARHLRTVALADRVGEGWVSPERHAAEVAAAREKALEEAADACAAIARTAATVAAGASDDETIDLHEHGANTARSCERDIRALKVKP